MNVSGDAIPALAQAVEDKVVWVSNSAAKGVFELAQASMDPERDMPFLLEALKCTDADVL